MSRQYYSMEKVGNEANVNIYGDISSYGYEGSVTARGLAAALEELGDVSKINVYINSYGGEVAEGLAIYNALKRHKAKVTTYCDGFAASIASVIFMAGDKRVMSESSLLMIHNAWTFAQGNAEELRKQADDLEKITQASIAAYMSHTTLSEEKVKELMDNESWILPEEALEYGFATKVEKAEKKTASQSARMSLFEFFMKAKEADDADDEDEDAEDAEKTGAEAEKPKEADEDTEETDEDGAEGEKTADEGDETKSDDEEDGVNEKTATGGENKPENELCNFFSAILKM